MMKKKTNKEKFAEMRGKDKVDYIWEYYKIHIISGAIGVFIVFSLLNVWVFNPPARSAVHVAMIGLGMDSDKVSELEDKLTPVVLTEDMKNKKAFVSVYPMSTGGDMQQAEINMATQTKLVANISARELDIVIANEEYFSSLWYNQQALLPLGDLLPEETLNKLQEEGKLVTLKEKPEGSDKEIIFGIDMSHNKEVGEIYKGKSKMILGVFVNTDRKEEAKKVIEWLLQN